VQATDQPHWDYNRNGADWPGVCGTGQKQSPIAILTTSATPLSANSGGTLDFGTAQGLKVINTGHSIQVKIDEMSEIFIKNLIKAELFLDF
jgi:carbonic anhydrase